MPPYFETVYPETLVMDFKTKGALMEAFYHRPTDIYDHFVLGRDTEPSVLHLQDSPVGNTTFCGTEIEAGEGFVFEDTAPRLADLTGDGENEVIVVRSGVDSGAQLTV